MTSQEAREAQRIAALLRAARKRKGYSQVSVAQQIGVSQSALSKMESGILIPSAPQWFAFCHFTGVNPDCLTVGYLDTLTPAVVETREMSTGFKMAPRYRDFRGVKARAALPLLAYFRESVGQEKLDQFFREKQVDPDFFVDLDKQINLNFILDLASELISSGVLKAKDMSRLTRWVSQPSSHGNLRRIYDGESRPDRLLTLVVKNARHYECDFSYKLEESRAGQLVISIKPEEHLREFDYRNELGSFLCSYKKSYAASFSTYGAARPVQVSESECHFKGADRCVYQIRSA